MKGNHLGEFEEFVLLTVRALGDDAYAVPIVQRLEQDLQRPISAGAVYAALERLERKGHLRSSVGQPTAARGGRRTRCFSTTPAGLDTLNALRRLREEMWRAVDARP
jgi:DNA-binding PadR family transcriptional regulator